jgi:hypothetical protein
MLAKSLGTLVLLHCNNVAIMVAAAKEFGRQSFSEATGRRSIHAGKTRSGLIFP